MSTKAGPTDLHKVPNTRTRKGIPLQPLSDTPTQDRDSTRALSYRETDQNMVPESTHEVKERAAGGERDQWAGPSRQRGTGENEAATAGETSQAGEPTSRAPRDPPSRPDEDAHRQGLQRPTQSEQGPYVRCQRRRIGNLDWFCII